MPTLHKTYEQIKQIALNVLEAHRVWEPPVIAARLANKYDFKVFSAVFTPEYATEVAGYIDVEQRKIVVNAEDIAPCQNFTIAHELGHFLLEHHKDEKFEENYSVLLRETNESDLTVIEREANFFADNLLVPAMFLRTWLDKYPQATDWELSRIFGVSPDVIRYRRPYI